MIGCERPCRPLMRAAFAVIASTHRASARMGISIVTPAGELVRTVAGNGGTALRAGSRSSAIAACHARLMRLAGEGLAALGAHLAMRKPYVHIGDRVTDCVQAVAADRALPGLTANELLIASSVKSRLKLHATHRAFLHVHAGVVAHPFAGFMPRGGNGFGIRGILQSAYGALPALIAAACAGRFFCIVVAEVMGIRAHADAFFRIAARAVLVRACAGSAAACLRQGFPLMAQWVGVADCCLRAAIALGLTLAVLGACRFFDDNEIAFGKGVGEQRLCLGFVAFRMAFGAFFPPDIQLVTFCGKLLAPFPAVPFCLRKAFHCLAAGALMRCAGLTCAALARLYRVRGTPGMSERRSFVCAVVCNLHVAARVSAGPFGYIIAGRRTSWLDRRQYAVESVFVIVRGHRFRWSGISQRRCAEYSEEQSNQKSASEKLIQPLCHSESSSFYA